MNANHAPAPNRDFDFLLGRWQVRGTRRQPDGSILGYEARWAAEKRAAGRVVMDEFTVLAPDGRELSTYVTLRTYCESTQRWEMAGMAAGQPAMPMQWHGRWTGEEMQLQARATDPGGRVHLTRIRFFEIGPERFRWESDASSDEGQSWNTVAQLVAQRQA